MRKRRPAEAAFNGTMNGPLAPSFTISVIVPTLNAARTLASTLDALAPQRPGLVKEIVIVDGGSDDRTVEVAEDYGCRVVLSRKGRGTQLNCGALASTEDWLLFLHADTRMSANWPSALSEFVARLETRQSAAAFKFKLDDDRKRTRVLEFLVSLRSSWLALPYGDQGLFISRILYDEVGGFLEIPLMEDVDIIRRIGRRRLTVLQADAVTSAEKYRREGYMRRSARNLICLSLYCLGVPPARIAKIYG